MDVRANPCKGFAEVRRVRIGSRAVTLELYLETPSPSFGLDGPCTAHHRFVVYEADGTEVATVTSLPALRDLGVDLMSVSDDDLEDLVSLLGVLTCNGFVMARDEAARASAQRPGLKLVDPLLSFVRRHGVKRLAEVLPSRDGPLVRWYATVSRGVALYTVDLRTLEVVIQETRYYEAGHLETYREAIAQYREEPRSACGLYLARSTG